LHTSLLSAPRNLAAARLMTRAAAGTANPPIDRQAVSPAAIATNNLVAVAHVPVMTSLIFAMLSLSSTKRS